MNKFSSYLLLTSYIYIIIFNNTKSVIHIYIINMNQHKEYIQQ
jgi:hypothetical protein